MRYELPNPQSVRDLRLMYETCGYVDGVIEHESLRDGDDMHEGDITGMSLRVVPSSYGKDEVLVEVRREQVTEVRRTGGGWSYRPRYLTDWSREYTFAEFRESPFYELMLDKWCRNRRGFAHPVYWDTHLMDEHEVTDNDDRWYVYAHVYEHKHDWLRNWEKTGRISRVDLELDEDGGMSVYLDGDEVFAGDVWTLKRIVEEHEEMAERMDKLKDHGIDLDGGTLCIKLWEE